MTRLQTWGAVALALFIVGVLGYCSGVKKGGKSVALQSMRDSLVSVRKEKAVIQKQRDSVGRELAVQSKKTGETRTVYLHDKADTRIVGDTARDSAGAVIQVLDPRISKRIRDTDAHVTSLEAELATAKFAIRIDAVFIATQEKETGLNEHIAKTVEGSRFSSGMQVGVGVCATTNGTTPCAYVGYGGQFRMP